MERFGTINTRKRLVSDFSKILSFAHRKHYKTKMTASNSQHYQSYPLPITRLSSIRSLSSHNLALARSCMIICSEQADEERLASFKSHILQRTCDVRTPKNIFDDWPYGIHNFSAKRRPRPLLVGPKHS